PERERRPAPDDDRPGHPGRRLARRDDDRTRLPRGALVGVGNGRAAPRRRDAVEPIRGGGGGGRALAGEAGGGRTVRDRERDRLELHRAEAQVVLLARGEELPELQPFAGYVSRFLPGD